MNISCPRFERCSVVSGSELADFPFLPELSNFGSPPAEPLVYPFIIIMGYTLAQLYQTRRREG